MASSTVPWLPPLMSHDHYTTSVSVQQLDSQSSSKFAEENFWINIDVSVVFCSYGNPTAFPGLFFSRVFWFPCRETRVVKDVISLMLSRMEVPFELDHIVFRESAKNTFSWLEDDTEKGLSNEIQKFLYGIRRQNHDLKPNNNVYPILLEISKIIQVSDEEYDAWSSWYADKKRANPDFERAYNEAIRRPRTEEELFSEQSLSCSEAATESFSQILEDVELSDSNSRTDCPICMEELLRGSGSKASGLPCSHVFHKDCILKWLLQSKKCPLCRFELPSRE